MANSCEKAKIFFGVIQSIYTVFSSSPKRWKILLENVPTLTLKPLSETRWKSRIESVKAIISQAPQIRDALLQLVDVTEDGKTKTDATTLTTFHLENFKFLLSITIWYDLLFFVNSISKING